MTELYAAIFLQAAGASEVIDRVPASFSPFVLPFVIGISFLICWLTVGLFRVLYAIPASDRRKLALSLVNPKIIGKNIRDLFCDCLFHVKIWQRKPLLGYMHSSIAFGWFMLIVLGHIEVALFVPWHLSFSKGSLYYPIFYRYFIWTDPAHVTLRGSFFFFLMDFFLLYVLTGVALAMFKRFRSIILGMRHTTKPSLADRVALYSLWLIFPLRLLAESFTADLSGGSFLTVPVNHLWHFLFGEKLYFMPVWWAYSICLGLFFAAMPFSRYMHILTEVLWILFRNAGLQPSHPRKGVAEAEIYACSSCGLCLDACPMNVQKKNLKYSSVYFIRRLRRHNERKINLIEDKCLMCDKCHVLCPVGVDAPALRRAQRKTVKNALIYDYSYLSALSAPGSSVPSATNAPETETSGRMGTISSDSPRVLYFAGCMTHLTPRILRSVEELFRKAGVDWQFLDREGGICCGRPLMLAGRTDAAAEMVAANKQMIEASGCDTLVLSCPICYKIFKEDYALTGIRILHYTQFIKELVDAGRLVLSKGTDSVVYHDPCELGRGCGVYAEPRAVLSQVVDLKIPSQDGDESVCCGGSLGSLTLNANDREWITSGSVKILLKAPDGSLLNPDALVTACPLCLKTFREAAPVPVKDFAEIVLEHSA